MRKNPARILLKYSETELWSKIYVQNEWLQRSNEIFNMAIINNRTK
jgi:hypothetical protein